MEGGLRENPSNGAIREGGGVIAPLHPRLCQNRDCDVERMRQTLQDDPFSLERLQQSCNPRSDLCEAVSPLHDACMWGHLRCLTFLVAAGSDVNRLDEPSRDGSNALEYAWMFSGYDTYASIDMMKILLNKGASPNKTFDSNYILTSNALVAAAENHKNDVVRLLLENGSVTENLRISESGDRIVEPSWTPITGALSEHNIEGYRLLLLHGASNRVFYFQEEGDLDSFVEYSIPHFILNTSNTHHCSTRDALEALKVYREFGGNLWAKDVWGGSVWEPPSEVRATETALELLRRSPDMMTTLPELEAGLERLMREPLSLKYLGRLAVRNAMGRQFWCNSNRLELPNELKQFLTFSPGQDSDCAR